MSSFHTRLVQKIVWKISKLKETTTKMLNSCSLFLGNLIVLILRMWGTSGFSSYKGAVSKSLGYLFGCIVV